MLIRAAGKMFSHFRKSKRILISIKRKKNCSHGGKKEKLLYLFNLHPKKSTQKNMMKRILKNISNHIVLDPRIFFRLNEEDIPDGHERVIHEGKGAGVGSIKLRKGR